MVKWLCKAAYGPLVKGRKKYERGENPSYDPLFAVGNILRDIYDDKVIVLAVSEYIVTTTGTFQYLVAMCDDEGKYDEKTSYSIEEDELYPLWLEEMGRRTSVTSNPTLKTTTTTTTTIATPPRPKKKKKIIITGNALSLRRRSSRRSRRRSKRRNPLSSDAVSKWPAQKWMATSHPRITVI